ncbi:hypothetical protein [Arthrobacter sp. U41]|nr:hypothetical protein [Arthrobacter sp. U41]
MATVQWQLGYGVAHNFDGLLRIRPLGSHSLMASQSATGNFMKW